MKIFSFNSFTVVLLTLIVNFTYGLYEDQIGKFDW